MRSVLVIQLLTLKVKGAQWLISRVLDSRPRSSVFEPNWHHCVVSLSKTHVGWLVLLLYVPSQQLWSLRDGQFT